jgi:hypothetical protein
MVAKFAMVQAHGRQEARQSLHKMHKDSKQSIIKTPLGEFFSFEF